MISFLASSAYDENENLYTKNNFLKNLRSFWINESNVVYIASYPDAYDITDEYANRHEKAYRDAGLKIKSFIVLDYRNIKKKDEILKKADVIILCGGHCPTEMEFFNELKLDEFLEDYKGIVVATSAGSMNAANLVYAQPELEGETSPKYQKYFEGLGICVSNILPHYQDYKNYVLDGLRVYEDITYADSYGKMFLCFPDGTYLFVDELGKEVVNGEFYIIKDGILKKIQDDNEEYTIIDIII